MQETCSSLVRDIADFKDHQRWFEFQQLYRPMIRKILSNKGLRQEELDDAVQEVFVSLLSTIDRFKYDRQKGKFRSWLSKITHRAASAQRRKQNDVSVDPKLLEEAQEGEFSLADLKDERMKLCLQMARSRFDEKSWLPFYLSAIEECPIQEIERITNLNRNAIYQAVHRVKTCLREMLTQLEHDRVN